MPQKNIIYYKYMLGFLIGFLIEWIITAIKENSK